MTIRKRPSLRDNMTEGDDTARQLEQAAEIEQMRRGDAAPDAPAEASGAVKTPFEDSPSPVAALAHAYMHGPSDGAPPPASNAGRGLNAVAAVLGLTAVGLVAGAGVIAVKDHRGVGATVTAQTPAPAAAPIAAPTAAPTAAKTAAPAVTAAAAAPADTQSRLGALEDRLTAAFSGSLTERVAVLEKQLAQAQGSAQVVGILAARQLRGALTASAPFHGELALARLSGVADGDIAKALDRVAPRAAEGIPTRGELAARFATVVPAVLNAELGDAQPGGIAAIGGTMWGWVSGVATVLRLPASAPVVEEGSSTALLTRAGIMLEAGDLSGAIERVSQLQGPPAEAAKPWVKDAQDRLAADQAVTLLGNRVETLLAAGKR